MITYRYVQNPKVGDLLGFVLGANTITPAAIVGFSNQGNIRIVYLLKHAVEYYKKVNKYAFKSVQKNHLFRIVRLDFSVLTQDELNLYNYLIHNTPLP